MNCTGSRWQVKKESVATGRDASKDRMMSVVYTNLTSTYKIPVALTGNHRVHEVSNSSICLFFLYNT